MPFDITKSQAKVTAAIGKFGLLTTVCAPEFVTLGDHNVVPAPYQVVGTAYALYQASPAARDQANALGIFAERTVFAVFAQNALSLISDRCVLKDSAGRYWIVHSEVQTSELMAVVAFKVLATSLKVKPDNVPV